MLIRELINRKREDLQVVLRDAGATNVRLLSPADANLDTGEADEVQLLVDFKPDRTIIDLVSLTGELEALLEPYRVRVLTERSIPLAYRARMLGEAVGLGDV